MHKNGICRIRSKQGSIKKKMIRKTSSTLQYVINFFWSLMLLFNALFYESWISLYHINTSLQQSVCRSFVLARAKNESAASPREERKGIKNIRKKFPCRWYRLFLSQYIYKHKLLNKHVLFLPHSFPRSFLHHVISLSSKYTQSEAF